MKTPRLKAAGGEVLCNGDSKRCMLDAEFPLKMRDTNSSTSTPLA
jgi:hypothetical protein